MDAWSARVHLNRDGEPLQFITVAISGGALLGSSYAEPTDHLMSAAVRGVEIQVKDAIGDGRLPMDAPSNEFRINLADVQVRALLLQQGDTPALGPGDVAFSFEV